MGRTSALPRQRASVMCGGKGGKLVPVAVKAAPQHPCPRGLRESPGTRERQAETGMPSRGTLEAWQQRGDGRLIDLAEESERDMPGIAAGPAEIPPLRA